MGDSAAALAPIRERVLVRDPANQLAHYSRRTDFCDTIKNAKALGDAEQGVSAKPEYFAGRALLAKILVRQKQCGRARNCCGRKRNPPALDTHRCFSWGTLMNAPGKRACGPKVRDEFAAA